MAVRRTACFIVNDLALYEDGREITVEVADGYLWRMELFYRELLAKEAIEGLHQCEADAVQCISSAHAIMSRLLQSVRRPRNGGTEAVMQAPIVCDGNVGRPRFYLWH